MEIEGIETTEFYPYLQAAKKIPGRQPGKPMSYRTIERWRSQGVSCNGKRIYLRTIRLGCDWFTCDAWVREFLENLNFQENVDPCTGQVRSLCKRTSDSLAARARLEKMWKRPSKNDTTGLNSTLVASPEAGKSTSASW